MFELPSKDVAVPVTPPDIAIVLGFCKVIAVEALVAVLAFPDKFPVKVVAVTVVALTEVAVIELNPVKLVAELPKLIEVEPIVILEFDNLLFEIAPANIVFVTEPTSPVVTKVPVVAGTVIVVVPEIAAGLIVILPEVVPGNVIEEIPERAKLPELLFSATLVDPI